MKIEFADERLSLIETDRAAETRLPVAVIQAARHRLTLMRAAPDLRTMQNWKSLRLTSSGAAGDNHLVSLLPAWRMKLCIDANNSASTIVITAMEQQGKGAT